MRSLILSCLLFNLIFPYSCAKKKDDDDKDDESNSDYDHSQEVGELSNTKLSTVRNFLLKEGYKEWTATAIHAATANSPHGTVRTFFNDTIKKSIEDGAESHPKGSITIKEIYKDDATTIRGYVANIKIRAGSKSDKDAWLFFEGFEPDYDDIYGIGSSSCTGCHSAGTDLVREPLP